MGQSMCTKCNKSVFEFKEATPAGSYFGLLFVHCASCGDVVGVVDYNNPDGLIPSLAEKGIAPPAP